jgi:hypothetical protein
MKSLRGRVAQLVEGDLMRNLMRRAAPIMQEQERRFFHTAFQNIQRQRLYLDLHGSPVQLCIYSSRPVNWHSCCQTRLSEYLKWQPCSCSSVTTASTSTWATFGAGLTRNRFGRTGARKCESSKCSFGNILCGRARRIQTPVGKSLQVQEVSYVGLTDSATPQPLFEFAIRAG